MSTLEGKGHAIRGLNSVKEGHAGLIGYADGSHIDVFVDQPVMRGNPVGVVAEAGSSNQIRASITHGQANCASESSLTHCSAALVVGHVSGNHNQLDQHDSINGTVTVTTTGNGEGGRNNNFVGGDGSRGQAALGIGLDQGSNNTLTQTNVEGSVTVTTAGNGEGGRNGAGDGSRGQAALGIGLKGGSNSRLAQTNVEGTVTVTTTGDGGGGNSGDASRGQAALGIGLDQSSNNTLTQTNVEGSVTVNSTGDGRTGFYNGHGSRGHAALGIGLKEGSNSRLAQTNVEGNVTVTTIGHGGGGGGVHGGHGSRGHAALGIGLDQGSSNTLAQIDVEGSVTVNSTGDGGSGGNSHGDASRGHAALGIGLGQGSDVNLMLFSGGDGTLPAVDLGDGGSCNPNGVIDRSGYNVNGVGCDIRALNTTQPQDWRTAQVERCRLDDCNDTSCHYVHERFHTLTATGSNQLILMSRQEYPFGVEGVDAQGVFRITRLTRGSGPSPQLDETFGQSGSGYLLYPAPDSSDFIQPKALLVSQVVSENQLTCLYYAPENGDVQLATFPLTLTGATDIHYQATTLNLMGRPVLLSDEGNTVWTQDGNHTVRRYDMSDGMLAEGLTYSLTGSMHGGRPVIAVGKDSQWLYVARTWTANQQVILERFNLGTTSLDQSWGATLDNAAINRQNKYDLMVENNQITLLPRGVVAGQSGATSSGLQVTLPEYGGCARWATTQVITTNGSQPMTTTLLMPTSSSPTDGSQPMTTDTPTHPSSGTTNDGLTLNNIVIPATVGGTVVTVACIATTGGVICCCVKANGKKTKRKKTKRSPNHTPANSGQFVELTGTTTTPPLPLVNGEDNV